MLGMQIVAPCEAVHHVLASVHLLRLKAVGQRKMTHGVILAMKSYKVIFAVTHFTLILF
jgi:hypothetical protein